MGAIGGMLGLAGGVGGTGIQGPTPASIYNPVTAEQIQSSIAGAQGGIQQQQDLLRALQAQQGLQRQSDVYGMFGNVAAGQGPNPAQAMLAQQTGANIANQAALMAGQRGAAQNVGQMARLAAQQGGALQQQAVGQGATMQAQQALQAMGQMGTMAGQMAGQQIGQTQALSQAQQAQQTAMLGAQQAYNQQQVQQQAAINQANAALATGQMGITASAIGGGMQALGASAFKKAAQGGFIEDAPEAPMQQPNVGAYQPDMSAYRGESEIGAFLHRTLGKQQMPQQAQMPQKRPLFAHGGMPHDYRSGGHVKAAGHHQQATKPGDSYANDKIPAVLSEHEIVIPRSVTMGKNPVHDSAKFVAAVLAKRKAGR